MSSPGIISDNYHLSRTDAGYESLSHQQVSLIDSICFSPLAYDVIIHYLKIIYFSQLPVGKPRLFLAAFILSCVRHFIVNPGSDCNKIAVCGRNPCVVFFLERICLLFSCLRFSSVRSPLSQWNLSCKCPRNI